MNQGRVITSTKEQITAEGARGGKRIDAGTVLLSFKLSIGKVALAGKPLYTNEAIAALPTRPGVPLDERFLLRALEAIDLANGANRAAMGATLNKQKLQQIRVPFPSLEDQRRIAAILDHADALRVKRESVTARYEALLQSIFRIMFEDPDMAQEQIPFAKIATLVGGRNLVADDPSAASPFRVLKISSVTTGQFRIAETKPLPADYVPPAHHLVSPGDLLMSRANTTQLVGAVALVEDVPPNIALPDKIWRFEWKDPASSPIYYHQLFRTPSVRRRISRLASGTGGSMKNVSKAKLEAMPLPRVPVDRQHEFATRAALVRRSYVLARRAIALDAELFNSLQSRAFRGEL